MKRHRRRAAEARQRRQFARQAKAFARTAEALCTGLLGPVTSATAKEIRFGNVVVEIAGRHAGRWVSRTESGSVRADGTDLLSLVMHINGVGARRAVTYADRFGWDN